ncbi:unnamed protein product (macronuclear) [Paramecium tetraurelia]|uniref:Uncharacterized protein n=1 Tax=Paramecium tetraurelia TaxID=5888 RepID=A0BKA5_PARTE|nr:uncharacterized protein GSPATT00029603001 [Paramecium tetraurelia]CAK58972.1 unnamed protein product [Paramecium tetraurelia]|eukprot:XP_001426370.1 hypothetical protein (macronuclear) [Paramecium tetraurelia strain d4-2]
MKFCSLFLKNLRKLLLNIDMFGSQINLQIKKENEYHTIFGMLMSLGILTLIYYSFLSLVIEMIERKSPNVLQNIQYQAFPDEYKLEQDSFIFYIVLSDSYGIPIVQKPDQLVYTATMQACSRITDSDNQIHNSCNNFTLKSCATVQINTQIQEQLNISKALLGSSVCLDPQDLNSISLSLQGTPQSPIFKSLQFKIEKCNNVTSGGKCASPEYIDKKLTQGYLGFFVSDSVLNQQKANNPFSLVSKLISSSISSYQYKSMTVWMRKSTLYNKENFFYYFENNKEYKTLLFERQSEQVFNIQQPQFIDITLYLDDREAEYYRTYNNILDILGQMGGLLELMLFLVGTIVKPFNKLSCDLFLASEIFYFEKSHGQQKIVPQVQGLGQSEGLVNSSQLAQLKKYFKLKAQQIKLYIYQYLFTCGPDRQLIQQSIESIYNQIDIIYIINKLIEIDKLKKILLNEDQQILFNFIHKPKIQLGAREKMKESINQNQYDLNKLSFEEEIIQAFNSYTMIKESTHKKYQKINQSILSLLDKDVKMIFETNDNQKAQKQTSILQIQQVSSFNDLSLQENRVDI